MPQSPNKPVSDAHETYPWFPTKYEVDVALLGRPVKSPLFYRTPGEPEASEVCVLMMRESEIRGHSFEANLHFPAGTRSTVDEPPFKHVGH